MISSPVLALPDDELRFHVWPDASPWAVGGILTQDFGNGHQPLAYEYHRLSDREQKFSQYEREALALLHCLRVWRTYIEGRRFTAHTDNSVVLRLHTLPDPHGRLARWIEEFQTYSPEMEFVAGKDHPTDPLSRLQVPAQIKVPISEVNTVITMEGNDIDADTGWPLFIANFLTNDEWIPGIPEAVLKQCQARVNHFEIRDHVLCKKTGEGVSIPYLPAASRPATLNRGFRTSRPGVF